MVCLDRAGYGNAGSGSYYYLRHLEPIALHSETVPGPWREREEGAAWGEATGPQWTIDRIDAENLSGTWQDAGKALPIRLERLALRNPDSWRTCDDASYSAPRAKPPEFERAAANLGDFAYTTVTYRPPAHFAGAVSISGFTFTPNRPGDARIVTTLAERLPEGTVEDDFFQCLSAAVAVSGQDGDFQEELRPHFVSRDFLDVAVSMGDYCGGAYPNAGSWHRTFDRNTGKEIALANWFTQQAFAPTEWGSTAMTDAMRALAVKHWPEGGDPECADAALEQGYWRMGLSADGLLVSPSFPHVAAACEEWLTVPWSQLRPYLSDKGKAQLARLR